MCEISVARAAPSTLQWNTVINSKSRTKFTKILIIKYKSGFLLSPTALEIAVKLFESI